MPKRNIKVKLPVNSPAKLIKLNKKIIEKHEELGDDSPLKELPMTALKSKVEQAETLRELAARKHSEAEGHNQDARRLLGIDIGQDSFTEGTVYYVDVLIRNHLLGMYINREESMSVFGFDVVIRMSKMPKRKKKENAN